MRKLQYEYMILFLVKSSSDFYGAFDKVASFVYKKDNLTLEDVHGIIQVCKIYHKRIK